MKKVDLPSAFVERVTQDPFLGTPLIESLEKEQPIAIRINASKGATVFGELEKIPWSQNGLYLEKRPVFTLDPHFHGGRYYPQEAGSQFIDYILRRLELPESPVVLDLCAAPGGKAR